MSDLFAHAGVAAPRRVPAFDTRKLVKWGLGLWRVSQDPRLAIPVQKYLDAHGLTLPDEIDASVLRFHSAMTFGDRKAPGLVWLLRDVRTDEPTGVLRVFLDQDGNVLARRALGRAIGAAMKLSPDEDITTGLHVARDIETGLRALANGVRPVWIASDPVRLPGVEVNWA